MSCCDARINATLLDSKEIITVAAVVMIDDDNRILLSKRLPGKNMEGLWEFPGGKLNQNETPEAALVREISEELGVKTCAGCLSPCTFVSYSYEEFHLLMPVFFCRSWQGRVIGNEGQELKWVYPKDLSDYSMPEANIDLVSMIKQLL